LRRYKAKRVKTRCYQEGVGQLEPRFQGEGVVPGEYFFAFYKTRHILPACDRPTDRQTYRHTEGIAVASTALARCKKRTCCV